MQTNELIQYLEKYAPVLNALCKQEDDFLLFLQNNYVNHDEALFLLQIKDKIRWYLYCLITGKSMDLSIFGYHNGCRIPGKYTQVSGFMESLYSSKDETFFIDDYWGEFEFSSPDYPIPKIQEVLSGQYWGMQLYDEAQFSFGIEEPHFDAKILDTEKFYTVEDDSHSHGKTYLITEETEEEFYSALHSFISKFFSENNDSVFSMVMDRAEQFFYILDKKAAPNRYAYNKGIVYNLQSFFHDIYYLLDNRDAEHIRLVEFQSRYPDIFSALGENISAKFIDAVFENGSEFLGYVTEFPEAYSCNPPIHGYGVFYSKSLGFFYNSDKISDIMMDKNIPLNIRDQISLFRNLLTEHYPSLSALCPYNKDAVGYNIDDTILWTVPVITYYNYGAIKGADLRDIDLENVTILTIADQLYDLIKKGEESYAIA